VFIRSFSTTQVSELAKDDISHGFSGAEIIGICREAALFAIEEVDELQSGDQDSNVGRLPQIGMRHLLKAIQGMQRQITEEMLQFYASYNESKALR
jgi:transitional endoplasmic reticulum ATPase